MQLGMIGLGRMGANIVRRLMRDDHECVVFDVGPEAVAELEGKGAIGTASLDEFVAKLDRPSTAATATTATTSTARRSSPSRGSTTSTSAPAAASSGSSAASA